MSGITLEQAQARLDDWIAADAAVARNQSYSINGRALTRADAGKIRENIEFWDRRVQEISARGAGGRRPRYIVGS